MPIVQVNVGRMNTWDTHGNNFKRLESELLPPFEKGLSSLVTDLSDRGLLDETLIVVTGEFGRTPKINKTAGRDHWSRVFSAVFIGGGIQGGQVVGASDERGAYVADRMISMGDLYATIYKALGIDWRKEYMSPIGRPVKIANALDDETGQPIKELI